jgi:electron transfer flavoprotein alpha subunit
VANAVVFCSWEKGRDGLPGGTEEVLTLAHRLKAALGTELHWLVLGEMPERAATVAGQYGVDAVQRIDNEALAEFKAETYVEALSQYCSQHPPGILLLNQTFDARVVAPRVAARTGAGVVMNAVDAAAEDGAPLRITASAYGGDTRVVYELTGASSCVVGVMADALLAEAPADAASSPHTTELSVDLGAVEERVCVVEHAHTEGPKLEDAQIIVAGGRGLAEAENFKLVEELAASLGGMAGATRPIVDDGWIDSSHQVGLTGKITRPVLYIAAGISGASQHMVGCSAAKTLVAINRDPDANIFRYATYGIVGDCLELLPAITKAIKGT